MHRTMPINVRFLASLSQTTGRATCTVDLPEGANLAHLVAHLVTRFPVLEGHQQSWHFAVNQTIAEPGTALKAGDRVAIFPYVAGG